MKVEKNCVIWTPKRVLFVEDIYINGSDVYIEAKVYPRDDADSFDLDRELGMVYTFTEFSMFIERNPIQKVVKPD